MLKFSGLSYVAQVINIFLKYYLYLILISSFHSIKSDYIMIFILGKIDFFDLRIIDYSKTLR